MNTPVADFLRSYAASGTSRLHMPGHKGVSFLGCEPLDLTEIDGADVLGQSHGILRESQDNAASLFGSHRTFYATGGSSQCVRAMLYIALACRPKNALPIIVAARNVHQAFVYGAALLDITPCWLWPRESPHGLCTCPIIPEDLEQTLSALPSPPAGVYVTSPDYLGGLQPIRELAQICHRHGTVLLVDNAHGAYLRFLPFSQHPMDMGADLCCDSAHKTLPVLTGGAYLHISPSAPNAFSDRALEAMAMFSSTSPSYLTLASLDLCNAYLAGGYPRALQNTIQKLEKLKMHLSEQGWSILPSDPLRLTVHASTAGLSGTALAKRLRAAGVECEFADQDYLVLMATPENTSLDFERTAKGMGFPPGTVTPLPQPSVRPIEAVLTPRQALFAAHETIPAEDALGRICGSPVVGFPPAVPIAVSGERLDDGTISLLQHYAIPQVTVVTE